MPEHTPWCACKRRHYSRKRNPLWGSGRQACVHGLVPRHRVVGSTAARHELSGPAGLSLLPPCPTPSLSAASAPGQFGPGRHCRYPGPSAPPVDRLQRYVDKPALPLYSISLPPSFSKQPYPLFYVCLLAACLLSSSSHHYRCLALLSHRS